MAVGGGNAVTPEPLARSPRPVAGARADSLRQHNLALLASTIAGAAEPLSRAELAVTTGLNRSTVTRLTDHLLAFGIVVERAPRAPTSGRPSVPLHPAPHTYVALGAEIAPDYVELCIVDLTGRVLVERHHEYAHGLPDQAAVLQEFASSIREMAAQVSAAGMVLVGVACGLPGLVDADGYLHVAPNLGWGNIDLTSATAARGAGHLVSYRNSAGLAAYAETVAWRRRGGGIQDFLFVTGSSGIGSALVRHGVIEEGSRGWAGELGHVVVPGATSPCSCGATGCLETVASRAALLSRAGFRADDPIGKLFAALGRRDPQAVDAVRMAGRSLGAALSTYLNLVDAPVVVFGALLERLYDHLEPVILDEVRRRVLSHAWAPVELRRSLGGPHVVCEGAAWQLLADFLNQPARWQRRADTALPYYSVDDTPEVTVE